MTPGMTSSGWGYLYLAVAVDIYSVAGGDGTAAGPLLSWAGRACAGCCYLALAEITALHTWAH